MTETQTTHAEPCNPAHDRLQNNYRRVQKLQFLRSKNIRYITNIRDFRKEVIIEDADANQWLDKFSLASGFCCSRAIGAMHNGTSTGSIAIKTAATCNHRLCNVCNALRAKKLRKKFFKFFADETKDLEVKPKYKHFFTALDNLKSETGNIDFISGADIANNFHFMHLTLTVPHKNGLWNGKEFYAKELLQLFNKMRKCDWWKTTVFAGEQTVETTQTENGLHIHIHALLLVRKDMRQTRNFLFGKIFSKWNELTVDHKIYREEFAFSRRRALVEVLSCIKDEKEFGRIYNNLDPRGSTMIDLKSLYKEITAAQYNDIKKGKFERDGKYYKYISENNPKDLIKGVLECLKYHFEPAVLENDDGKLEVPFLLQLLPNIYRQRLYGKFGFFYGLTPLNIAEEPTSEDEISEFVEDAADAYDPHTGEPCIAKELLFVIVDIKHLTFAGNKRNYYVSHKYIKHHFPPNINTIPAIKDFMGLVTNRRINATMQDENIVLN